MTIATYLTGLREGFLESAALRGEATYMNFEEKSKVRLKW